MLRIFGGKNLPILVSWCIYYFSTYSGRKYHIASFSRERKWYFQLGYGKNSFSVSVSHSISLYISSRDTKKNQFLNSDVEKPVSPGKSHSMGTFLLHYIGISSSGSSKLAFLRTAWRYVSASMSLSLRFCLYVYLSTFVSLRQCLYIFVAMPLILRLCLYASVSAPLSLRLCFPDFVSTFLSLHFYLNFLSLRFILYVSVFTFLSQRFCLFISVSNRCH